MPGAPGTLAALYSLEDMRVAAKLVALAEGDVPDVWLGLADFVTPDSPFWVPSNAPGGPLASRWLDSPQAQPGGPSGNGTLEPASCGYLGSSSSGGVVLRSPCSVSKGFLCMSASAVSSPQHAAVAELTGDGLPDLALALRCPWDGGASLIALQQPSPQLQLAPEGDLPLVTPSLSARTCGDGIPVWQREECDMGTATLVCNAACGLEQAFRVQASAREAFISVGAGNISLEHAGVNVNLFGQVRGFRDLADPPGSSLLFPGFSLNTSANGFPQNQPIAVHKSRGLSPGIPFQFRALLSTDLNTRALPDWSKAENETETDPSWSPGGSSCGCSPDNPGGLPQRLSVEQQFGDIAFSWVVGSACEASASITRALLDEVTLQPGPAVTVAQLSIGLACGTLYRPSKTEVDEGIVRDGLQVGRTYRYCVSVASAADANFFLDLANPTSPGRFVSEPTCRDVTIAFAAQISGQVLTRFDTPAPGVRLTARIPGTSHVASTVTDDSGRYALTFQATSPLCDPVLVPEACSSQLVRLVASARTKLRSGRVLLHSFSMRGRPGGAQTLALGHMQVLQNVGIVDESAMPITGTVRWPGSNANAGYAETRGCPIVDARVCAVTARDNSTISCVSSGTDGSFQVVAGVDADGSFEVSTPLYDFDTRNVETRVLQLGLVGGLCEVQRMVSLDSSFPYTALTLPALAYDVQFVGLSDPAPGVSPEAVQTFLAITGSADRFVNLTSPPGSDTATDTMAFVFYAPKEVAVQVCRDIRGALVFCGEATLSNLCVTGTSGDTYAAVYSAFSPPDSALVGKEVVVLKRAAKYKVKITLYEQYGRQRCNDVQGTVLIQDSITGEDTNQCSVAKKGCTLGISLQATTNTSTLLYDLVPGAPNFGAATAYALPLSISAPSAGWPSRSFLLYAIVEGTKTRAGTGYIEVPMPVPLLILRDPPGDRSFARLNSSLSTAVKLSMFSRDQDTCGGLGNPEAVKKALPWPCNYQVTVSLLPCVQ
ncbi:hypothetical protein HYH03_013858 [Edaphochlamys debaryana]|uniref:C-type lectin domain-containing protein n=1 Tax=Edaphochlamys debaryana TaxID=47281 RepID=A0A835XXM3_9CHLO|nr:hypothetical protein HYH03_013858 [Edaphochlamys debaryana]|eukprot:KAG2487579.1 hypothetical protein HYH03_013858 [Edaphochlamys debaryana]